VVEHGAETSHSVIFPAWMLSLAKVSPDGRYQYPCAVPRLEWSSRKPWPRPNGAFSLTRSGEVRPAPRWAGWPLAAHAQQTERMRRIGVLAGQAESDHEAQSWVAAFREELQKLGWTEGRNIEIDTRWARADVESMKRFAKELVALQPDFILTSSTTARL
jgi:hypothetical protein